MKSYINSGNLLNKQGSIFDERTESHAKKLMQINFEIVDKQISLSDALGMDIQFHKNYRDEFYLSELAIELMTGAKEGDEMKVYLEELISNNFFNLYCKKLSTDNSKTFERLINKLCRLMVCLPVNCKYDWCVGGKETFLKELIKFFPDGGSDFIRAQFSTKFKSQFCSKL